jgi:hypothetical protein
MIHARKSKLPLSSDDRNSRHPERIRDADWLKACAVSRIAAEERFAALVMDVRGVRAG